jgi:hypothetical protein
VGAGVAVDAEGVGEATGAVEATGGVVPAGAGEEVAGAEGPAEVGTVGVDCAVEQATSARSSNAARPRLRIANAGNFAVSP